MTSDQRQCDVMTSHWRWSDAINVNATWWRRIDVDPIWCQNDVVLTSMRRIDVDPTSFWHQMPAGYPLFILVPTAEHHTIFALYLLETASLKAPKYIFTLLFLFLSLNYHQYPLLSGARSKLWMKFYESLKILICSCFRWWLQTSGSLKNCTSHCSSYTAEAHLER